MIVENDVNIEDYGIRRLTPRECWRLMDFSDSDFDKAKYERGTVGFNWRYRKSTVRN